MFPPQERVEELRNLLQKHSGNQELEPSFHQDFSFRKSFSSCSRVGTLLRGGVCWLLITECCRLANRMFYLLLHCNTRKRLNDRQGLILYKRVRHGATISVTFKSRFSEFCANYVWNDKATSPWFVRPVWHRCDPTFPQYQCKHKCCNSDTLSNHAAYLGN